MNVLIFQDKVSYAFANALMLTAGNALAYENVKNNRSCIGELISIIVVLVTIIIIPKYLNLGIDPVTLYGKIFSPFLIGCVLGRIFAVREKKQKEENTEKEESEDDSNEA